MDSDFIFQELYAGFIIEKNFLLSKIQIYYRNSNFIIETHTFIIELLAVPGTTQQKNSKPAGLLFQLLKIL